MPGDMLNELIQRSGLFDPDFYRDTYGHLLGEGEDPLGHFLATGLAQGHLPSVDFDPVIHALLTSGSGDTNPLLHGVVPGTLPQPPLTDLFPGVSNFLRSKNPRVDPQLEPNRAYAISAANARDISFEVEERRYTLTIPEPGMFLARLKADQPYAYARLPHGFWDAIWMLSVAEEAIGADPRARGLSPEHRHALAMRLCAAIHINHGGFLPSFMSEVLADIPVHAGNPDFFRAVSFKGFPTFEEDVYGERVFPPKEGVLRHFSDYFEPGETIYDGTQWKRLLIAGHLNDLPSICRDRPVVVVASRVFSELGQRWKLNDFTFIEIPLTLSQRYRWELLARISEAVTTGSRNGRLPVVLTRCGGSLAYWLITRLFARLPRAFYFDMGQALSGWFFDVLRVTYPWMRAYVRPTITNGLEPFYRERKGADYDEWLKSLP